MIPNLQTPFGGIYALGPSHQLFIHVETLIWNKYFTVRQIADHDLWNGDKVWTLYSISCEVHGITLVIMYVICTLFLQNDISLEPLSRETSILCKYGAVIACLRICFTSPSTIVQSCGGVLLEPVLCREDNSVLLKDIAQKFLVPLLNMYGVCTLRTLEFLFHLKRYQLRAIF